MASPTKSSDEGNASKRRRLSRAATGKVAAALEKLQAQEEDRQREMDIQLIVARLRESPGLIISTKAFVMAGCKMEGAGSGDFPRGARTLGMSGSKIPQRDAMKMFSVVFKVSPTVVRNIPNAKVEIYRLISYGLSLPPEYRLETQNRDAVSKWMQEQYESQGKVFANTKLDVPELKWHTGAIGLFRLKTERGVATHVVRRKTGQEAPIKVRAPAKEWSFEKNWIEKQCFLIRCEDGMESKLPMTSLFQLDGQEVVPWPAMLSDGECEGAEEGEQEKNEEGAEEGEQENEEGAEEGEGEAVESAEVETGEAAAGADTGGAGGSAEGGAPPPPAGDGEQ